MVDMDFPGKMKPRERKSLCSQINFLYARNKEAVSPFRISLFGVHEEEEEQLFRCGLQSWGQWGLTWSREPFTSNFPASEMVYLTADARVELKSIDPNKVYIIGGLVDRNRHKGTTLDKAQALHIPTRKFPIKSYLAAQDPLKQFSPKQVLTVNHVVNILIDFQATRDWHYSFAKNLPRRAYKSTENESTPPKMIERPKIATEQRKTAVVIGATTATGRAHALRYLQQGLNVVVVDDDGASVERFVEELRQLAQGTDAVVLGYQGKAGSDVDMSRLKFVLMPYVSSLSALVLCESEEEEEKGMDRWVQPIRSLITMLHPRLRLKRTSSDSTHYFLDFKEDQRENDEMHHLILVPGEEKRKDGELVEWIEGLQRQISGTGVDKTFTVDLYRNENDARLGRT